ncbi:hypothetical protein ANN_15513 [Periplaneta americana]|uniref:Ig-like domain-containing protein n=1 Tax=Periplaneta americana TaxID=6978 RepID=A0ABQ8SGK2_PERAM|nr:hypothetical protein ANN_15513 [Periplaneta americana]
MDVAGSIPGLPGLFVAGVFSASLSSMSSCLNCLAATIYEDFVRPNLKGDESEQRAGWIMKTIVLVVGAISVLLVFVVEQLGGVLEISYSAQGITCGALLGLFSLGIFFPWANAKGALWGSIASLGIVSIIVFGAQRALATGKITHKTLPTSVLGCLANTTLNNSTVTELLDQEQDEAFVLFRISYWYYGVVGSFTVIIVGMLISAITGLQNPRKLNIVLIAPFLRNYVTRGSEAEEEVVELTEKDLLTMTQEQNSYVPPDILDYPTSTDMVVREGTNVTLRCAATGSPQPNITWRREGGEPIPLGNGQETIAKTIQLKEYDRKNWCIKPQESSVREVESGTEAYAITRNFNLSERIFQVLAYGGRVNSPPLLMQEDKVFEN